jgi:hypothetical protein
MREGMQGGARAHVLAKGRPSSRARALRLIVLGPLLAYALLAGSGAVANASTTLEVRGEFEYKITCSCTFPGAGVDELPGVAVIDELNSASGVFGGVSDLVKVFSGKITGTIEGSKLLNMILTTQTTIGEQTLTLTSGEVEDEGGEITGSGYYGPSNSGLTGTFIAKRIRSYEEVLKEEESKLKAKKEALEKTEKEALEKAEKEARELAAAKEGQAKAEKEAQEKATKEAKEKEAAAAASTQSERALTPANPLTKTLAVAATGTASFDLANANDYAISGEITLTGATGKAAVNKKQTTAVLGSASFTIPSGGKLVVKIKLSKSAAAELRRRKKMQVVARIATNAAGQATVTKTYGVTLTVPSAHKRR